MTVEDNTVANSWLQVPIYAILLFEVAALIARSFIDVQMRDNGYDHAFASDLSYLIVPALLLILMYPAVRDHGHLIAERLRYKTLNLRLISIGISLGFVVFLASVGSNIALSAWNISEQQEALLATRLIGSWTCDGYGHFLLGVIVSAVLIPVIEETINRGFLLQYFIPRGKIFAILLSSILFAVLHKTHAIPTAFIIGIYLAYLTLNTGSLLPAIIAHSIHNLLVQIDVNCISIDWVQSNTVSEIVKSGFFATAITALLLLIAGILVSRKITGARIEPL